MTRRDVLQLIGWAVLAWLVWQDRAAEITNSVVTADSAKRVARLEAQVEALEKENEDLRHDLSTEGTWRANTRERVQRLEVQLEQSGVREDNHQWSSSGDG